MTSGQLEVWVARVDAGNLADDARARLSAALDDATRAKLGRMRRAEDRDRGLAAHALLRRRLGAELGVVPHELEFRTHCPSCGSRDHGKPFLAGFGDAPPVRFNLSHAGELIAVAIGPGDVEVGVDVESATRTVDWAKLRRSIFAGSEWAASGAAADPDRARTDSWSRKEAAVKATGFGLSTPLHSVVIEDDASEPGRWTARIGSRAIPGWDLAALGPGQPGEPPEEARSAIGRLGDLLAGYAAAVALDPTLRRADVPSMPVPAVRIARI